MMSEVTAGKTDDPRFIKLLNALVRGLIARHAPEQLWIIQIDNWFNHKWLGFSGIGIVDFNVAGLEGPYDAALTEFRQDKVAFPPFNPNRVASQWSYLRAGDRYVEAALPLLPHPTSRRPSGRNLHRRVQDFGRPSCYVWYSANTLANGRGSMMVYNFASGSIQCWFAGFSRGNEWKLDSSKGVRREDIQQLLDLK